MRIGNSAYQHRQHDVWGALLDSAYLRTRTRDSLDGRIWPLLKRQVETALRHWREPDRGIWEVRGQPRHFTSSKIMCWVAADRGARLARLREDLEAEERWTAAAKEIHDDICAHAVDERGVFTQHYETDALDASLLLIPLLGFLPPDDPRVRATVMAVAEELTVDGLVLRYRVEETDDGLAGREGTFTICSFWLVTALAEIGEYLRARQLCEKLLSYASPLDLYAEQVDSRSGRHLGNFPQAFTHLALINALLHVIHCEHREADALRAGSTHGMEPSAKGRMRKAVAVARRVGRPVRRRAGNRGGGAARRGPRPPGRWRPARSARRRPPPTRRCGPRWWAGRPGWP